MNYFYVPEESVSTRVRKELFWLEVKSKLWLISSKIDTVPELIKFDNCFFEWKRNLESKNIYAPLVIEKVSLIFRDLCIERVEAIKAQEKLKRIYKELEK